MLNSKSNQNEELIFPEETPSVISDLLKKYGLEGSPKEIFEKLKKREVIPGEEIAKIAREALQKKLSFQKLVSSLQTKLNIPPQKAEKLAEDIRRKILSRVEKPSKGPPKPEREKIAKPKEDIYREPIE